MNDEALLHQLRVVWEAVDRAPEDLADRVLFTLQLADLECELLRLRHEDHLAGVRTGSGITTVTFECDRLVVMLMLPAPTDPVRRLDGWISPAAPLRVEARTTTGSLQTTASPQGRFSFPDLPAGLLQLVVHPMAGAGAEDRPVVTPAIQL
jgi:hypothetical protein